MHALYTVLFFISLLPSLQSLKEEENKHVKFEIRLTSVILKPGGTGEIILHLTPNEGIHINTDPAMEFEFEKKQFVHFVGITSLPKDEKTGYLDTKKPVKYAFKLNKKISRRKHTLKGNVRYFFCSDVEGWCNRFVQPIELAFTVTR